MEFTDEELRSITLEAEMLQHASKMKRCGRVAEKVAGWLEKHGDKLHPVFIDALVENALSLAEESRRIADTITRSRQ